jgi:cell division protein FtsA
MLSSRRQSALITGLDIGSTAVRVAVGQSGNDGVMNIIAVVEVPSSGIERGVITSIEEVVSTIAGALEQAERLVGVPLDAVWVGITGNHIMLQPTKGVVAVAKADGEISEDDVLRAHEASRMVGTPLNYEVIDILPRRYTVDGQTGIKDPVGMTGVKLEVEANMLYVLSSHLKNIERAVYRTGYDIHDLVVSIFATSYMVTTARQRDMGVAVVDIGGATTHIAVYENNDMLHSVTLPMGSVHVTSDIAIGLRTDIDVAERVKILYGHCLPEAMKKKDMVNLADVGAKQSEEVSRQYIAEIASARMAEILEAVDRELARIDRSGRLPAGVVFIGGGSKIEGLLDLAKDILRLPVAHGTPIDMPSITQKIHDVAFIPAVGLVRWGNDMLRRGGKKRTFALSGMTNKVSQRLQKVFKSLIP